MTRGIVMSQKKKMVFHWLLLFFVANLFLFWIIGLAYVSQISLSSFKDLVNYQKFCFILFGISSYISHLALLSLWPLVILIPLLWVAYLPRLILSISVIISIILVSLLIIDIGIYVSYRFHLNGIIMRFIWDASNQNVFGITRNELMIVVFFVGILSCLEYGYALWLWRFLNKNPLSLASLKWYGCGLAIFFYISYATVFYFSYSNAINARNIIRLRLLLEVARFLPGYTDILSIFAPVEYIAVKSRKIPIQSEQMNIPLKYPLSKLEFKSNEKPMNVVMIVLDSWRFDAFNNQITPNINHFSKKSWVFSNHLSGGNGTGPGIFSLFYGIPGTYWTAMLSQHRSPLLLDALQKNYDIKVISSAELFSPPLHKTVFQKIKDLQINQQSGSTPKARDLQVTQQFKAWANDSMRLKKPFFTFLLYDSAHSYCETEYQGPFNETGACNRFFNKNRESLLGRYKNAAYFLDQQIQEVISTLEAKSLLKNTIIIITADHGEEFDDNHLGYWGHGSNYTLYQIKVPLIVYWPGQQPREFSHQTSHFDIVPTLMTRLLGCVTKSSDYTVGTDLLNSKLRLPMIITSYMDFGVLEDTRVTRIFSTGNYLIENDRGEIQSGEDIHISAMRDAFKNFIYFN